jgi:GNAT superfamily N-acetyltransferase
MPDTVTESASDLIVRLGVPDDFNAIMALALAVAGENAPVLPSESKIMGGIWQALNLENGHMVGVVAPRAGPPHGFVLLQIGAPWYSDERLIQECGVYVHPEWRSAPGGRAALLYRFAKDVADRMGYKLAVGVLSRHRLDKKLRYYERFFGQQAGAYFVYDPAATAH